MSVVKFRPFDYTDFGSLMLLGSTLLSVFHAGGPGQCARSLLAALLTLSFCSARQWCYHRLPNHAGRPSSRPAVPCLSIARSSGLIGVPPSTVQAMAAPINSCCIYRQCNMQPGASVLWRARTVASFLHVQHVLSYRSNRHLFRRLWHGSSLCGA